MSTNERPKMSKPKSVRCKGCGHRAGTITEDDNRTLWLYARERGLFGVVGEPGRVRYESYPVATVIPGDPWEYLRLCLAAEEFWPEGAKDMLNKAFATLDCSCGAVLRIRAGDIVIALESGEVTIDPRPWD